MVVETCADVSVGCGLASVGKIASFVGSAFGEQSWLRFPSGSIHRASASPRELHCCCVKHWGGTLQVAVVQHLHFFVVFFFFTYLPWCGQASVQSCPAAASSHQDVVRGSEREAQNCNSKINKIKIKE